MKKKRKKQRRECVCVCVMGLLLVLTVGTYSVISWVCPGYGLAAKQEKAGESLHAAGPQKSQTKNEKNKKIEKKTKNHPHT